MTTLYSEVARLVGSNFAFQGGSVSVSADGTTLAVGGLGDNNRIGAVWVFIRSGNAWIQQGSKLVGTDFVNTPRQGVSVSLSADGNTLAIGGPGDDNDVGAVWIFVRNAGVWLQQGNKLVGSGAQGSAVQGQSVSLTADGNTLAIGGFFDNRGIGATWIFKRSGILWTQFNQKLVGTNNMGNSNQGFSVSLSADGKTLAIGGPIDASLIGATWIFILNNLMTAYIEEEKLVGPNNIESSLQGNSVSLSEDGTTLAIGGPGDSNSIGATWIFIKNAGIWSYEAKLIGLGNTGRSTQGAAVALSYSGDILAVGGSFDNNLVGATWVFRKILGDWFQQGQKLIGSNSSAALQGFSVSLSADSEILAVGGPAQDNNAGVTFVFSRKRLACVYYKSLVTVIVNKKEEKKERIEKEIQYVRKGDIVLNKDGNEVKVINNIKFGKTNKFVKVGNLIVRPDHPVWNSKEKVEQEARELAEDKRLVKTRNMYIHYVQRIVNL